MIDRRLLLKVAFSSGETGTKDLLPRISFKSSILYKNTAPQMTHFGVEFQNRSTTTLPPKVLSCVQIYLRIYERGSDHTDSE